MEEPRLMKLFVWEGRGVLTDYTDGMIVAVASDLAEALLAIEAKCNYCMDSFPQHRPTEVHDLGNSTARVDAWVCYGGG